MDEWSNRFKRLAPALRDDGVITVGNRISKWLKNNFDRNYLILLPAKSEFLHWLYVIFIILIMMV